MGIEGFLAINMAADFTLLASVSRIMGLFSWKGVMMADTACAVLTAVAAVRPSLSPFVALASPAVASLIVTHRAAPRLWSVFTLTLFGQALLCGGIARLLPLPPMFAVPICLASGALLTLLVGAGRPLASRDWLVSLCLSVDGRSARFWCGTYCPKRATASWPSGVSAGKGAWPASARTSSGSATGAGDTADRRSGWPCRPHPCPACARPWPRPNSQAITDYHAKGDYSWLSNPFVNPYSG